MKNQDQKIDLRILIKKHRKRKFLKIFLIATHFYLSLPKITYSQINYFNSSSVSTNSVIKELVMVNNQENKLFCFFSSEMKFRSSDTSCHISKNIDYSVKDSSGSSFFSFPEILAEVFQIPRLPSKNQPSREGPTFDWNRPANPGGNPVKPNGSNNPGNSGNSGGGNHSNAGNPGNLKKSGIHGYPNDGKFGYGNSAKSQKEKWERDKKKKREEEIKKNWNVKEKEKKSGAWGKEDN